MSNGLYNLSFNRSFEENESEVIKALEEIEGNKLSDEQLNILKTTSSQVVLSCAGSGKTTTISDLIVKRIITHEISSVQRLICLSFSVEAAGELSNRLKQLTNKFGIPFEIEVQTIHAFLLRILRSLSLKNEVMSSYKYHSLMREAINECKLHLDSDETMALEGMISYQANNMLKDEEIVRSSVNRIDIDLRSYTAVKMSYTTRKMAAGLIDYDDMLVIMYNALNGQNGLQIENYVKSLYDYFIIDEAQDNSTLQFEIIKRFISFDTGKGYRQLCKNLVYVGDDDQCVYEWRGANHELIMNISGIFDIKSNKLSTNYRCCSNIVDFAFNSIKRNVGRSEKGMTAFNDGGSIDIVRAVKNEADLYGMTDYLVKELRGRVDRGEFIGDSAVIVRNNRHATLLCLMLFSNNIMFVSRDNMKVSSTNELKELNYIIKAINNKCNKNETATLLSRMIPYLGMKNASDMVKIKEDYSLKFDEFIKFIYDRIIMNRNTGDERLDSIKINKELDIFRIKFKNILTSASLDAIRSIRKIIDSNDMDFAKKFNSLFMVYFSSTSEYLYKNPDKQRFILGLEKFLYNYMMEHGIEETKSLIEMVKRFENSNSLNVGKNRVLITTEHSAKGKEWNHVYMLAIDNMSAPNLSRIEDIVGFVQQNKNLTREEKQKIVYDYIDGERRLHYVGTTRAKEKLTIITSYNIPMFVKEQMGVFEDIDKRDSNNRIIRASSDIDSVKNDEKEMTAKGVNII